jgi:putative DNA primase/helicase
MIAGCADWQGVGLAAPDKVMEATKEYLYSQDALAQWLEDRCDIDNPNHYTASNALFADWKIYAETTNEYIGIEKGLVTRLSERGYQRGRNVLKTDRGFNGIKLKDPSIAEPVEKAK